MAADYIPLSTLPDALAGTMTHWPDQPNQARPYIDALMAFAKGGLQGVANQRGIETPAWSRAAGDVLSSDAANAAIGMAAPLKGPLGFGAAAPKSIRAYHGSPYDFDRFDISKIGTGEGAQAYGHGLYFAENPEVAEGYRRTLGKVAPDAVNELALDAVSRADGDIQKATAELDRRALDEERDPFSGIDPKHMREASARLQTGWRPSPEKMRLGKTYEVAIKADPEHFLDWDKPLGEQNKKVQKAFLSLIHPGEMEWEGGDTIEGRTMADLLRYKYGKENAIAELRKAGVPGIKYLDQGSRVAGEGSRNYVVFDDKLIDILKKYGLAGLLALPALGAGNKPRAQ